MKNFPTPHFPVVFQPYEIKFLVFFSLISLSFWLFENNFFFCSVGNLWGDKSFTFLLELLKDILLEGNKLLDYAYGTKKILYIMGMDFKKIYGWPNDCILYQKQYKSLDECLKCQASHYKLKMNGLIKPIEVSTKVLWYLLMIPRFKPMFANVRDAKKLT